MRCRKFQRWFNIAPWPNAEYITDQQGEKFWLTWEMNFRQEANLWVYYKSDLVGIVDAHWDDDDGLFLADINIPERYSFLRNRGLGSQMMQRFIERARAEGARYIKGIIIPHDGSTQEYDVEWYKRRDFQVDGSSIYLDLQADK